MPLDKIKTLCSFPLAAAALLFLLAGCATMPPAGMSTVYISGVPYTPLDAVCSHKGIRQEYDGLTRTIALFKESSAVRFQVGRKDVLLDGRRSRLNAQPEYYKGLVVIPQELRQKIDELFPEETVSSRVFRRLKKVVIDPGHGGKDPGAIGTRGILEKDMTLDIARKLRDGLTREGVEVVMTRSSDVFIPLDERAAIANSAGADLFVSIHANANPSRRLKGFEVYYISPAVSDSKRAFAAAREASLKVENFCLQDPSLSLKAILWDMTYSYDRREAIELSRMLCKAMRSNADTKVLGVKNANFAVLRGAAMPAVLAEVGFLTNPSEELLIASESYRRKLAESIKEGIRYYCEGLRFSGEQPAQRPKTIVRGGP